MKTLLKLWFLLLTLIFFRCETDHSPQPVEPITDADTTESVIDKKPTPPPVASSDSAYYRAGIINDLPVQVLIPVNHDSATKYPLVIFLHGIDERGTDNKKQLRWGASLFQSDSISKKYPAFVVFPQCPNDRYWHHEHMLTRLKSLIDTLVIMYGIDPDRVYIEGLSMGAYGTYAMVARYPDLFAAAIAISGDGDRSQAHRMKKTDWKIYAGDKDKVVPSGRSKQMAEALTKAGARVTLKVYPNADHATSWINALAEPDHCQWLFGKRGTSK